jgi:hypothetical protein
LTVQLTHHPFPHTHACSRHRRRSPQELVERVVLFGLLRGHVSGNLHSPYALCVV